MRLFKYIAVFLLGFLLAKLWYEQTNNNKQVESITLMVNEIKNISKLVVSQGHFSEIYNFSDTKKYFFDYLQFQKKAMISVNATVEVGYDLSKIDIQLDSIHKEIIINSIPKEEIFIAPEIKYFDLKQSQFNSFSNQELNTLHVTAVNKVKESMVLTHQKKKAKKRLFQELSKLYQLSKIYQWKVIDNTEQQVMQWNKFKD